MVDHGLVILEMKTTSMSLEEVFLELTEGAAGDADGISAEELEAEEQTADYADAEKENVSESGADPKNTKNSEEEENHHDSDL
ncbi:MAG: hypothetical protein V8S96_00185 [Lachnospiraceae bacterium]